MASKRFSTMSWRTSLQRLAPIERRMAYSRRREYAIRLSMGASRWRLVRQLMVENLLLAIAGGGVALAITFWTARTLGYFLPGTTLPLNINGSVDGTVTLRSEERR